MACLSTSGSSIQCITTVSKVEECQHPGQTPHQGPNQRTEWIFIPMENMVHFELHHTSHSRCASRLPHKWGLKHNPVGDCRNGLQTTEPQVNQCSKPSYTGDISAIHSTSPEPINWSTNLELDI